MTVCLGVLEMDHFPNIVPHLVLKMLNNRPTATPLKRRVAFKKNFCTIYSLWYICKIIITSQQTCPRDPAVHPVVTWCSPISFSLWADWGPGSRCFVWLQMQSWWSAFCCHRLAWTPAHLWFWLQQQVRQGKDNVSLNYWPTTEQKRLLSVLTNSFLTSGDFWQYSYWKSTRLLALGCMLLIINVLWIIPDSRPDVLPHWLPTAHSWCQQLRVGWANPTGASPDAPSVPGGCGREPPPSSISAAGARAGGLQGWAAYPTDGSHFLRYTVWSQSFLAHVRVVFSWGWPVPL